MKNCSLFLPIDDLANLANSIKKTFEGFKIDFNNADSKWDQVKISKKTGWFGSATLLISLRGFRQSDEFVPMLQGMMNFVGQIPAQNQKVHFKLMTKIQNTKLALGVKAESGYEHFEAGIFNICQQFDGFAFVDGTNFMDFNQKLILNTSGQSEVADLNVPDAAVQLGQADTNDAASLYASQVERKKRNIAFLKSQNVPTIEHLPCIIADEEVQIRSKEEVLKRTIATAIAAVKGEGIDQATIEMVIKQFDARSFFSPEELVFINNLEVAGEGNAKFSWRYEDLWVFLWTLGFIDNLDFPTQICDVPKAVGFIRDAGSFENMLSNSKMRSNAEILDQADLIYRLDWACVNARLKNQVAPAEVDAGVVFERHYALNWLIRYQNQEWDDVRTDN
jgi:Domain of unknown function (DUF4272)